MTDEHVETFDAADWDAKYQGDVAAFQRVDYNSSVDGWSITYDGDNSQDGTRDNIWTFDHLQERDTWYSWQCRIETPWSPGIGHMCFVSTSMTDNDDFECIWFNFLNQTTLRVGIFEDGDQIASNEVEYTDEFPNDEWLTIEYRLTDDPEFYFEVFDASGTSLGSQTMTHQSFADKGNPTDDEGFGWTTIHDRPNYLDNFMAETTDPFFDVTITSTNSPVGEGELLEVDYEVTNTGGEADTQDITLDVEKTDG